MAVGVCGCGNDAHPPLTAYWRQSRILRICGGRRGVGLAEERLRSDACLAWKTPVGHVCSKLKRKKRKISRQ